MNVHMWRNPATQADVATLRSRGIRFVMPQTGLLACGDVGEGKLAEVSDIVGAALDLLAPAKQDMASMMLVISRAHARGHHPVRYIANASTGKMGYAIAREASRRGATVTLVSGPVSLAAPRGVYVVPVVSASQMRDTTVAAFTNADAAICAAAVADYTPAAPADHKLKKGTDDLSTLRLVKTADILAELSHAKGDRVVVGFAAETNDLLKNARAKLERKGCDLIVANDAVACGLHVWRRHKRIALVWPDRTEQLDTLPLDQSHLSHLRPRCRRRVGGGRMSEACHGEITIACHLSVAGGFAQMGRTALGIGANTFAFFTRIRVAAVQEPPT